MMLSEKNDRKKDMRKEEIEDDDDVEDNLVNLGKEVSF